jgi:hypothetical protein
MLMIVAGRQISYAWGLVAFAAALLLGVVFLRAIATGHGATEVEAAREQRLGRGGSA